MDIRQYLRENVLIFDGAMGTYYAGLKENPLLKCELANLNEPQAILSIHKEYIAAGSNAIKTNTFGANTHNLECNFQMVQKVIAQGFRLAQKAAEGTDCFVFADIGPIPGLDGMEDQEEYIKIVDVFLEEGAEYFLFETFGSGENLEKVAAYIKQKTPDAFIILSFAVTPEGYTRLGFSGEKLFQSFSEKKLFDALGFNCVSGPYHLLKILKNLDYKSELVSIMPNAGYPTVIQNRTFFADNAHYFASQMQDIVKAGASIIGGCCGTTPDYIKSTVEKLKGIKKESPAPYLETSKAETQYQKPNRLLEKLSLGKKIIAVELDPPLDTDILFFMEGARKLKEANVDVITIADCPIARARVDSSILACKLERELGITPLPHMTCRDRNINATKALLLGMNIEGVNNVLVVTGDPIPTYQRDEIKAIFNFNSVLLANYIKTLNESTFSTPFHICGALNVNALNFDAQLKLAERKVENGIETFLTQPILTKQALENLKLAKETLPARILGGIIPIVSHKNACFMDSEISGISVSQEIIDLYEGKTKEEAVELAVKISVDIAEKIKNLVDGYYFITPFKRVDIICQILEQVRNFF